MKPSRAEGFAVPSSRLARLARLGGLASGVAGGMLAEGARQWMQGKRPRVGDLLLTPANARRVTEQLAHLRGAAMKVGQLLSMDAGELLPPELSEILSRLRSDARPMPMSQLVPVLNAQWGEGWERHFSRFSFTPMAAASIGQVHQARDLDDRQLAIKVQYPGVRESIDSDVNNVATLLRVSGLLPKALDLAPLLEEAKRQLHAEADYLQEAAHLLRYRELLASHADCVLPEVVPALTTESILSMSFVAGEPIESLQSAPQSLRDHVIHTLMGLLFRELFEFGLIQTDPNFANYLFQPETGKVVLLDFGATRPYSTETVEAYRALLRAGRDQNLEALDHAASRLGYFQTDIRDHHRQSVLAIFLLACEPLRHEGAYDFARSDLAMRMHDTGLVLARDRDFWHSPPADALFLHRKVGGLYLLAARLGARVDIAALFEPYSGS